MNYNYTSIKVIDGKIKAVVNKDENHNSEYGQMRCNPMFQEVQDRIIKEWQQNNEVFDFANPHEEGKIMRHLGGMNPKIKYGVEVTYIEIKDGKAWFKEEKEEESQEENQTKLMGEVISIVKNHKGSGNALFALLTNFKITRK